MSSKSDQCTFPSVTVVSSLIPGEGVPVNEAVEIGTWFLFEFRKKEGGQMNTRQGKYKD